MSQEYPERGASASQQTDEPLEWVAVLEGRRDGEEVAAAMLEMGAEYEDVQRDRALYTPIAAERRAELIGDLVSRFADSGEGSGQTHRVESRASIRPRRLVEWAFAGAGMLAAAAVLSVLWSKAPVPTDVDSGPVSLHDVQFNVQLEGGRTDLRAAGSDGVVKLSAAGRMRIIARPQRPQSRSADMVLIAYRGELVRTIRPSTRRGAQGALEAEGSVRDVLGLRAGRWTLAVVIGSASDITANPGRYRPGHDVEGTSVSYFDVIIEQEVVEVDVAGCEVRRAHRCVVEPDAEIRLWVHHPRAGRAVVSLNGQPVEAKHYSVEGESGAGLIVRALEPGWVTVSFAQPLGIAPWSMVLDRSQSVTSPDDARWLAHFTEQRESAERANGEHRWAQSVELGREAMNEALARGFLSRALEVGVSTAFVQARHLDDAAGAREVLDELAGVALLYPEGEAKLSYYRGVVAMTEGQVGEAVVAYEHASRVALRLQESPLARAALSMFALQLIELGRYEQAASWSQVALRMSEDPCDIAKNSRNAGWAGLLLRVAGIELETDIGDPRARLERAFALYGPKGECSDVERAASSRVSLAILAAEEGRWMDARTWIEQVDAELLSANERLWLIETELRVALATDPSSAPALLARFEAAAADALERGAGWRVALRRGEVMESQHRTNEAIDAYREAERELDREATTLDASLGRDVFLAQRGLSAQRLVSVLIANDRPEDAMCVARLSRMRAMPALRMEALSAATLARLEPLRRESVDVVDRIVEARGRLESDATIRGAVEPLRRRQRELLAELLELLEADGRATPLGCDRLRPPRAGELLVTLFPLEDATAVLASDSQGAAGYVASTNELEGPELLGPLYTQIERASQVKVIAVGRAASVDVHALVSGHDPLIERIPVVYSVDLPRSAERDERGDAEAGRAVLIADPTGTLGDSAVAEVDSIARVLEQHGWSIHRVDDAAFDLGTVRELFEGADLVHYAGHAASGEEWTVGESPSIQRREFGWADHLVLGESGDLSVVEIMLLERAPRTVVLMGCSTGFMNVRSPSGGMNLALAFLLAGTDAVVASSSPLPNTTAAEISRHMYNSIASSGAFEPARSLRKAQIAVQHTMPRPEWSKIRVWVR